MGDRGNIVVRSENGDVWLYTHWHGTELKDILKSVLVVGERWDDAPSLTRMIFSAMTRDAEKNSTGFGISTHMLGNEHGILVVDVPNQKVCRMEESALVRKPVPGKLDNFHIYVLPEQLDYRVSRTFSEYAHTGFKKRIDRRHGWNCRRGTKGPSSLGGRRLTNGRRKDD